VVTAALREYVLKRQQMRVLNAFGAFSADPTYDYKTERQRHSELSSKKSSSRRR
jgi:hypothetical protein